MTNVFEKLREYIESAIEAATYEGASFGFPNDRIEIKSVHFGDERKGNVGDVLHPDKYIRNITELYRNSWIIGPLSEALTVLDDIQSQVYPDPAPLRDALQAIDFEQSNQEPDYKWLAMDEGGTTEFHKKRPEIDSGDDYWSGGGGTIPIDSPPSFLKPRQLWERQGNSLNHAGFKSGDEDWNGYWWRLVEDHNVSKIDKDETLDKKNITDETQVEAVDIVAKCLEIVGLRGFPDLLPEWCEARIWEIGELKERAMALESAKPQEWIPTEKFNAKDYPKSVTLLITLKNGNHFWPGLLVIRNGKPMLTNPEKLEEGTEIVAFKPIGDLYRAPEESSGADMGAEEVVCALLAKDDDAERLAEEWLKGRAVKETLLRRSR